MGIRTAFPPLKRYGRSKTVVLVTATLTVVVRWAASAVADGRGRSPHRSRGQLGRLRDVTNDCTGDCDRQSLGFRLGLRRGPDHRRRQGNDDRTIQRRCGRLCHRWRNQTGLCTQRTDDHRPVSGRHQRSKPLAIRRRHGGPPRHVPLRGRVWRSSRIGLP